MLILEEKRVPISKYFKVKTMNQLKSLQRGSARSISSEEI